MQNKTLRRIIKDDTPACRGKEKSTTRRADSTLQMKFIGDVLTTHNTNDGTMHFRLQSENLKLLKEIISSIGLHTAEA